MAMQLMYETLIASIVCVFRDNTLILLSVVNSFFLLACKKSIFIVISQQAVHFMESQSHDQLIQGYFTLARFADSQYSSLTRQMESKIHEAKRQNIQESKV